MTRSKLGIERAKSGVASCRHCGRAIARGEYRFGRSGDGALWFHLDCAAIARPADWKPFAARAAKLRGKRLISAVVPRNRELEAAIREHPDDLDARGVYADWLTTQGDPWGEVIALALGGKLAAARKRHAAIAATLTPGFSSRCFTWNRGFIMSATLAGSANELCPLLDSLFALRTALVVRSLALPSTSRDIIASVSRQAPPSLASLFLGSCRDIDGLASPQLHELAITIDAPLELANILAARAVPAVRDLVFTATGGRARRKGLTSAVLDALLASPLFAQLEDISFCDGALDDEGAARLVRNKRALAHLRGIHVDPANAAIDRTFAAKQRAFWKHLEARDADLEVY